MKETWTINTLTHTHTHKNNEEKKKLLICIQIPPITLTNAHKKQQQ